LISADKKHQKDSKKKVVIAIGGNAILQKNQIGTFEEQQENTQKTAKGIASIVLGKHLYKISAITHGNGPQVGNLLLQQESTKNVPRLPMHTAVAMTQGQIGYMLQQALQNEFKKLKKDKKIVSLITQTVVAKNDPKLVQPFPSKPIGPYFTELEAKKLGSNTNQIFKKVKPNGVKTWRRVVPSPKPLEIVELDILKELAEDSCLLIAAGGGGIPVIKNGSGFEGVNCVIDKDRSASLLAKSIKASVLLLLTDIDKVKLNYGKSDESDLDIITVKDAKKFLKEEQFLEGSMEPKIQASIDFLESGGDVVIITSFDHALAALNGKAGTRIISKN
jgi:carbamate kinase